MATYYLNSAGSNTAPYDTKAKGSTSYETIRSILVNGDTIVFASDFHIDNAEDSTIEAIVSITSDSSTKHHITSDKHWLAFSPSVDSDMDFVVDGLFIDDFQFFAPPISMFGTGTIRITNCYLKTSGMAPSFGTPIQPSFHMTNCVLEMMEEYGPATGLYFHSTDETPKSIYINNNVFVFNTMHDIPSAFAYVLDFDTNAYYGTVTIDICNNIFYQKGIGGSHVSVVRDDTRPYRMIFNCNGGNIKWTNTYTTQPSSSNKVIDPPGFIGDGTNGYDDYYLATTSDFYQYGFRGLQIGIGEIAREPKQFWLNPGCVKPTPPYSTKQTGAHTIHDIRTNTMISTDDTCFVARGTTVTEPTFYYTTGEYMHIFNLVAEDDGKNFEDTRPVIEYTVSANGPFFWPDYGTSATVSGIKYISHNRSVPDFGNFGFFVFENCIMKKLTTSQLVSSDISATNCLFVRDNDDGGSVGPIVMSHYEQSSIKNCTFIEKCTGGIPVYLYVEPTIVDCVFYAQHNLGVPAFTYSNDAPIQYENNVWYTPNSPITTSLLLDMNGEVFGTNIVNADPLFLETEWYTIGEDSPAYKTGTSGANIGWSPLDFMPVYLAASAPQSITYYYT